MQLTKRQIGLMVILMALLLVVSAVRYYRAESGGWQIEPQPTPPGTLEDFSTEP